MGARLLVVALVAALASALPAAAAAPADDAWALIAALRRALEDDSPLSAGFTQTFTPAGFSGGDSETGSLALALPECLRWDYAEPFAKTYLVCGTTAYTWNAGETSGRRMPIPDDELAGLDLLRLDTAALAEAFTARIVGSEGTIVVELSRRERGDGIGTATIALADDGRRLASLAYTDAEGNRTVFALEDYRELADRALLRPPADLDWIEE